MICMLLQLNHHQEIVSILKNSSTKFEKFVLTVDDYQNAQKDQKEILLRGNIYDIKEVNLQGQMVELVAYHDEKEEGLISLIEKFFDDESSGNGFSFHVLKLLVTVYTFSPQHFEFSQPLPSGIFTNTQSGNYLSFVGETLTPPPDAVS